MDQIFPVLGQWAWFVVAAILLILELISPGVFFMWLAIAAAVTGVAAGAAGLARNTSGGTRRAGHTITAVTTA